MKNINDLKLSQRLLLVIAIGFISGCGQTENHPKTSLYEEDHHVAPYWPTDLADVAHKLKERLTASSVNGEVIAEIKDLVSWTAEIAADSDLSEADWLPLYQSSEAMQKKIKTAKTELTAELKTQLGSFCELIESTAKKIPDEKQREN